MSIEPDTKDWTWVLERECADCGFDAASYAARDVADGIRRNARAWQDLLAHPAARTRPRPDQWSATEYACHVRDVYRLFDERLRLMLEEDDPLFANWDQDATAIEDRYDQLEPAAVLPDLATAAERLAARFESVRDEQWSRTGTRSDGARFTVDTFSRYLLHDPVHHVHDVETGYRTIGG